MLLVVAEWEQLWPCYCHEHTLGPYVKLDESSVRCRDRKTNRERTLRLYPQVTQVVHMLRATNIGLSLASRSPDSTAARGILSALELWSCFTHPQIYSGRKTNHFRLIRSATDIPYQRMLFFDDEPSNIEAVRAMGVVGCLIDKQHGLSPQVLVKGLRAYAAAQKSKSTMLQWLAPKITTPSSHKTLTFSFEEPEVSTSASATELASGESRVVTELQEDELGKEEMERIDGATHDSRRRADGVELEETHVAKKGCVQLRIELDAPLSVL